MNKAQFLVFLLLPFAVLAGPLEYKCKVNAELSLQDDGQLKPYSRPQALGKTFDVDRIRGTIVGSPLRNLTASEVRVLQKGDESRTFQLLSVASPTAKVTTDLLSVHEFVRSTKKPFVAVTSAGEVYSGICE